MSTTIAAAVAGLLLLAGSLLLAFGTAGGTPPPYVISKDADNVTVTPGSPIGFRIELINQTGGPATMFIQDNLPGGPGINWSIDSVSPPGTCQIQGSPPNQFLGCAAPNATDVTVHVTSPTTAQSCGAYSNQAAGAVDVGADIFAQASTTVVCGQTPTPTPPPFSITVLKLNKANNNPVPGVHISLYAGAACTGNPLASDDTNDHGLIDFPLPAQGTYSVKEDVPTGFNADPDGNCKKATLGSSAQSATVTSATCPIANSPFPAAGCDEFDSGAQVNVQLADGSPPFAVTLNGPTLIQRSAVHAGAGGKDMIDTEIISLELTGTSPFGPIAVHQSASHRSLGSVTEESNDTPGTMEFPARSFFDIFVDITTDVGVLHNNEPVHMGCEVTQIPPILCLYQPPLDAPIPLYTAQGSLFAYLIHTAHVPLPPGQILVVFNNPPASTPTPTPTPAPTVTPPPLSAVHYKCYNISQHPLNNVFVNLRTQFGVEQNVQVTNSKYLCPPVVKTLPGYFGEGDLNGPHLKCYDIQSTDHPTRVVTLTDQFVSQTGVAIGLARELCVPAIKAIFPGAPTGTLPAVPHYKCYEINGVTVNFGGVRLDTQFGTENNVTVGKAVRLCAPAIKTFAGVSTGALNVPHLVCYVITPQTSASVIVNLKTQFGLEQDVSVLENQLLCVPAVKKIKVKWGDFDCNGLLTIGDAQKIARFLIGLPIVQDPGCPMPGDQAMVEGMPRTWGDLDCMADLTIGDAQKTARKLIGLPIGAMEGCPMPDEEVEVS